ncbi:MAG TPA: DUF302 domain-containing protein [Thiobacillus sp.]|nr:MAG: hypothetical protein B7Y21_03760 [Hydrogenophilales bacterium 16-61-112]OZA44885.1 MAG: hypothetical protein B7X81_09285 [Hydrogenophilales bacterium 17-61-76]HQT35124.1 DUF302 domain-containing protein [Thiobacillus sp.]HQT70339.1 DUF302 domain-containing protein [Thiobacillus sp.]
MKKIITACVLFGLSMPALATDAYSVLFKTQGDFSFVRDSVQSAIEGKGLVINHTNLIAGMLERTGKDLGATKQVYTNGEQFEFCSATISRAMMEADPHAITMCPYIVSVYTIPGDANVYVAYRKPGPTHNPALKKALDQVETLLSEIIEEVL